MGKLYAMHLATIFFTSTAFAFEPKVEDFPSASPASIKRLLAERSLKFPEDNRRSGSDVDYFDDFKSSKRSLLNPVATGRQLLSGSTVGIILDSSIGIGNIIVLALQFKDELLEKKLEVTMINLILNVISSVLTLVGNFKKGDVDGSSSIEPAGSLLKGLATAGLKTYKEHIKDMDPIEVKTISIYGGIFAAIAVVSVVLLLIPVNVYEEYMGGSDMLGLYVPGIIIGRAAGVEMIVSIFLKKKAGVLNFFSLGAKIAGSAISLVANSIKEVKQWPLIADSSIGLIINTTLLIQHLVFPKGIKQS